jgi:hypothetical protein
MSIEKLRATVSELEQELRALPTVDAEARSVLEEVVGKVSGARRSRASRIRWRSSKVRIRRSLAFSAGSLMGSRSWVSDRAVS